MKVNFFLICLFPLITNAQGHYGLFSFTGDSKRSTVQLNWSTKGGFTCQGMRLYRNGELVHSIDGICGSADQVEHYSFKDTLAPAFKLLTYQLELGQQGYSDSLNIFHRPANTGDLSFQFTSENSFVLRLFGSDFQNATIHLYQFNGQLLWKGKAEGGLAEIKLDSNSRQFIVVVQSKYGVEIHEKIELIQVGR